MSDKPKIENRYLLAFPGGLEYMIHDQTIGSTIEVKSRGLNKREYFAVLIMQSLINEESPIDSVASWNKGRASGYAKWSVVYADALLNELEKSDE